MWFTPLEHWMTGSSADGLGTRLRRLLELLDGDLQSTYTDAGLDYRPRYTPVMKALSDGRALTIKAIARQSSVSHSAASQTVSLMLAAGLLDPSVGSDARERRLSMTPRALAMLPALEAYWAATAQAAEELEAEIDVSLGEVVVAAIQALEARSFRERIHAARGQ